MGGIIYPLSMIQIQSNLRTLNKLREHMSIALECSNVSMEPISDWEEMEDEKPCRTSSVARRCFENLEAEWTLCKRNSEGKVREHKQMKSTVFSIITGVAIVGLGIILTPVSGGASAVVISLGASIVGSAIQEEIKEACKEDDRPRIEKPPEQFDRSIPNLPSGSI